MREGGRQDLGNQKVMQDCSEMEQMVTGIGQNQFEFTECMSHEATKFRLHLYLSALVHTC